MKSGIKKIFRRLIMTFIIINYLAAVAFSERIYTRSITMGVSSESFPESNRNDMRVAIDKYGKELGKRIERDYDVKPIVFYDNIKMAIHQIKKGIINSMQITPLRFVLYRKELNMEPVLISKEVQGGFDKYLLITHIGSDIKTLAGLKSRHVLICEDPKAESILFWFDVEMMKAGFKEGYKPLIQITKVKKVSQAVLPVYFKQGDACLVSRNAFEVMVELNPDVGKKLLALSSSPGFVTNLVCVKNGTDRDLIKEVKKAALGMHNDTYGKQILLLFRQDSLVDFEPEHLANTEKLVREYKKLKGIKAK